MFARKGKRMSRKRSKKVFKRGVQRQHPKNRINPINQRGGTRL